MNPWYILKIDKTDDKNAVRAAYMNLLPKHNPEDDAEGFANLRRAYEEALKEIDQQAAGIKKDDDPVSIFFAMIEELYKDFSRRIDPANWEDALQSDVCTALDTEEEVDAKMLDFISRNHNLPTCVWVTLNSRFLWAERADQLRQRYSPGLINSIIGCVNSKFDLFYELFEYDPGADVDRFIFLRNSISQAIDNRKKDEADGLLDEIKALGVRHPIYDIEMARYLTLSDEVEKALVMVDAVMERHHQFTSEPFALYVKGSVLLGFDDKAKLEESLSTYKSAVEIVHNYFYAQLGVVDALVKLEKYDEAEKYLVDVMLPQNPSHSYIYSYIRHVSGLSIKKYEALYADNPTPENTEKLAQYYSRDNQYDKCIALLKDSEKSDRVCYLLGYSYSKLKDYDLAVKYALESIDIKPAYYVYNMLSGIYFEKRQYENVIENADKALSAGPTEEGAAIIQKARLLADKAYACMKLGRYNRALELIDEAIAINDRMTEAYADKAEILMYMGRYRDGFTEAEKAMNLMPTWSRPYEVQADIFYRAGSFDQMTEIFKKTDEMQMKSQGLTYFKGCRAGAVKEYGQCYEILSALLEEENLGTWEDKALDALCHYSQNAKDYDKLAAYAERLIQFFTKNNFNPASYAYIYLATAHKNLKNPDKRLEALLDGLQALPDNERLLTQLGYHYDDEKSLERYNTWKRLMDIFPQNAIAYSRLAMVLCNQDKYQDAIDIVNKGLAQIPGSLNLHGRRGYVYLDMDEYQKAIDDFLPVAENPQNQSIWWSKGMMYYEIADIHASNLNDRAAAIKYYVMANDHGGINTNRKKVNFANIYLWQKEYEKAIAIYDECVASDPKDDYFIFNRGDTYKRMGDSDKAKADFEMILELAKASDKTSHNAYRYVGYAHLELGNANDAKTCFEKAEEVIKTDGTRGGKCFCIYQNWARYYLHVGDCQKALEQVELAIGHTNSVWNNELKREIEQAAVLRSNNE